MSIKASFVTDYDDDKRLHYVKLCWRSNHFLLQQRQISYDLQSALMENKQFVVNGYQ